MRLNCGDWTLVFAFIVVFGIVMQCSDCLIERFRSIYVTAKVWRWWKEKGWPEAQRKRPEQQHQPHSSAFLIGDRELLKSPRVPFLPVTPPSVFIPHTMKEADVWSKTLSSVLLLLAFFSFIGFLFFFCFFYTRSHTFYLIIFEREHRGVCLTLKAYTS